MVVNQLAISHSQLPDPSNSSPSSHRDTLDGGQAVGNGEGRAALQGSLQGLAVDQWS